MAEAFKSFLNTVEGDEERRCHYPTRLDTYGCGCRNEVGVLKTYSCKWCKAEYKAIRPRLFCNASCYHEWQRTDEAKEPKRPKAICENCGNEFYAHGRYDGKERRFCSKTCANQHQQKVKPYTNWIVKTCPTCGQEFKVKQSSKNQIFCSKDCYSKAQIQYTEGRRVGDRMTAKLRRKRLNAPIDKAYLRALKIVQNDRCVFCGETMNGHGTIEHLRPVSNGGKNDWWNIVLCCKSCNSRKGALDLVDYAFKTNNPAVVDITLLISYKAHKIADRYKTT